MELGLAGKTAIITGGSAGIGLACAKVFYSEGVSVLIAGRDAGRLAEAEKTIRASLPESENRGAKIIAVQADMSQAADIERIVNGALEQLGKIDILVNNAGSARAGSFLSLGDD